MDICPGIISPSEIVHGVSPRLKNILQLLLLGLELAVKVLLGSEVLLNFNCCGVYVHNVFINPSLFFLNVNNVFIN